MNKKNKKLEETLHLPSNCNFSHNIAGFYGVNHFHPVYNLSEYGVDPIQVWLGAMGDEKLAAASIFTSMCHG